jgi:2-hydroxychromene-2-carboxylate isomerase
METPMAFTHLDYFFCFRTVDSYLLAHKISKLAEAGGVQLSYYPLDLGDRQNQGITESPADHGGRLPHVAVPTNHGVSINLAAGMILASQARRLASDQLAHATLAALWRDDRDISDPAVMVPLADQLGMDGALLMCEALEADVQTTLSERQRYAAQIGITQVPSYATSNQVFVGNEGLQQLTLYLAQQPGQQ